MFNGCNPLDRACEEAMTRTIQDTQPPEIRRSVANAFMQLMQGEVEADCMVMEVEHYHCVGAVIGAVGPHYGDGLPKTLLNLQKIERVLVNLITNAFAAMDGKKSKFLTIETGIL